MIEIQNNNMCVLIYNLNTYVRTSYARRKKKNWPKSNYHLVYWCNCGIQVRVKAQQRLAATKTNQSEDTSELQACQRQGLMTDCTEVNRRHSHPQTCMYIVRSRCTWQEEAAALYRLTLINIWCVNCCCKWDGWGRRCFQLFDAVRCNAMRRGAKRCSWWGNV